MASTCSIFFNNQARWARWLSLLAFCSLLLACAARPPAPSQAPAETSAPSEVGVTWRYQSSTSYESAKPGLGVSHSYHCEIGWSTVYDYTLQRTDWSAGTSDAQFDAHFKSTINEVVELQRAGAYTRVVIGASRELTIGGQSFRAVSFDYSIRGQAHRSQTYLTARQGRLLKFRISYPLPVQLDIDAASRQLIERVLKLGPRPSGVAV